MVDARGKRFVDETRYPGGLGIKMLDLPGKKAYEIFDERIYELHRNAPGLRNLSRYFDEGLLLRADTPEKLAARLAIDAAGLKQTIEEYNDRAASGGNDAFGRALPEPLRAPFYGIKVTVALVSHTGRVESNPRRPGPARRRLDYFQSVCRRRSGGRRIRRGVGRLSARQRVARFSRSGHASGGTRGGVVQ